jgi:hypothetical protein
VKEIKLRRAMFKPAMAALIAVTATYAGKSAGSVRGNMDDTGGMTGWATAPATERVEAGCSNPRS